MRCPSLSCFGALVNMGAGFSGLTTLKRSQRHPPGSVAEVRLLAVDRKRRPSNRLLIIVTKRLWVVLYSAI